MSKFKHNSTGELRVMIKQMENRLRDFEYVKNKRQREADEALSDVKRYGEAIHRNRQIIASMRLTVARRELQ